MTVRTALILSCGRTLAVVIGTAGVVVLIGWAARLPLTVVGVSGAARAYCAARAGML